MPTIATDPLPRKMGEGISHSSKLNVVSSTSTLNRQSSGYKPHAAVPDRVLLVGENTLTHIEHEQVRPCL